MGQNYESQPYEVLQSLGDLEIRFYPSAMMAKPKQILGIRFQPFFAISQEPIIVMRKLK